MMIEIFGIFKVDEDKLLEVVKKNFEFCLVGII